MKKKIKKKQPKPNLPVSEANVSATRKFPEYPLYSANEDIYNKFKEEERIDPEDISKNKALNENDEEKNSKKDFKDDVSGEGPDMLGSEPEDQQESVDSEDEERRNEKDFKDDVAGDDLDVPGSELDDQQERVGSEDEENNYYSLGGDNHNDLEESKEE